MKVANLKNMKNGWFIGNFEPTLLDTNEVEIAVKSYSKGDYDPKHYHKVATEYTVIITGCAKMNGVEYHSGDIIVMEPGESTDFECLEDGTTNVVVKIPCVKNDKYGHDTKSVDDKALRPDEFVRMSLCELLESKK